MNSDQSQISVMNSDEPQVSASKDSIVPKGDGEKGANTYATKKTVLQGLLDMALLIRNSKILKDYIQSYTSMGVQNVVIVLCCFAILVQIASAILFLIIGRWNWEDEPSRAKLDKLNNATLVLVLISLILEAILGAFDDRKPLD